MAPSKGEQKIIKLLKKEGVSYTKEKIFEDIGRKKYRFDFFLPYDNICIEYDGEEHFYQVKFFQPKRADFLKAQESDRRKNAYCLAHRIKLYRIPFWKIEEINSIKDIFQKEFLVSSKFHNDMVWKEYQKTI